MAGKESWFGEATFRKLALLLAQLWIVVTVGAQVMVLAVWVMIFIQNLDVFDKTMDKYIGNDKTRYDALDGNPGSGYVAGTNMPKQLGGAVFASVFAVAMWIFVLISLAADISWRYPAVQRFLLMWHAPGLWTDKNYDELDYWFIYANAFLKIFIVTATGSTTFIGLLPNNPQVDAEIFALFATFILLASIPLTMLANITCVHALKRAAWPAIFASRKADIESAAGSAAVGAYKKEEGEKAAKAAAAAKADRDRRKATSGSGSGSGSSKKSSSSSGSGNGNGGS